MIPLDSLPGDLGPACMWCISVWWSTICHYIPSAYWLTDQLTFLPESVIWNDEASLSTHLWKASMGWGKEWPAQGGCGHSPPLFQTISVTMSSLTMAFAHVCSPQLLCWAMAEWVFENFVPSSLCPASPTLPLVRSLNPGSDHLCTEDPANPQSQGTCVTKGPGGHGYVWLQGPPRSGQCESSKMCEPAGHSGSEQWPGGWGEAIRNLPGMQVAPHTAFLQRRHGIPLVMLYCWSPLSEQRIRRAEKGSVPLWREPQKAG